MATKIRALTAQEQVQWTGLQQSLASTRARAERVTRQRDALIHQLAELDQRLSDQEADAATTVQAMEPAADEVQFDGVEWAFYAADPA